MSKRNGISIIWKVWTQWHFRFKWEIDNFSYLWERLYSPLCSFKLEPGQSTIILLSGQNSRPFSYPWWIIFVMNFVLFLLMAVWPLLEKYRLADLKTPFFGAVNSWNKLQMFIKPMGHSYRWPQQALFFSMTN